MDITGIRKALARLPIAAIHYYHETDSTNQRALESAINGASEYTLFIAKEQTSGRGRANRRWITTPGASLAFSLIIHPTPEEKQKLGLFSLVSALAVCHAVESLYQVHPEIKWPNDILLAGKKWCGILVESVWQAGESPGLVLGIGINLTSESTPPDDEVLFPATCLAHHVTGTIRAPQILACILKELFTLRSSILTRQTLDDYQSRLAFMGEGVILTATGGKTIRGILKGVDMNGHIILLDQGGQVKTFPVGELQLRPKKGWLPPAL